ncbi:MAG: hypothetical protein IMX02_13570 [Limnochordaceae bacterium]|nr:hypothetical protein [Limnochordaceae bacterium]
MEVQAAVPRELTTDPDVEIVRRMAAGEQEALLQLHRRYRRRVLGYIVKLVRDPALAEEVLQDVWLAAWQGAGRFRGASRVSTWLLGIAHHRSLNAFRQADRRRLEPVAPERLAGDGAMGRRRGIGRRIRARIGGDAGAPGAGHGAPVPRPPGGAPARLLPRALAQGGGRP